MMTAHTSARRFLLYCPHCGERRVEVAERDSDLSRLIDEVMHRIDSLVCRACGAQGTDIVELTA